MRLAELAVIVERLRASRQSAQARVPADAPAQTSKPDQLLVRSRLADSDPAPGAPRAVKMPSAEVPDLPYNVH